MGLSEEEFLQPGPWWNGTPMANLSLAQDIQELALEVLLCNAGTEHDSVAAALQKLAEFIMHATEAGATAIAESATRLVSSIGNVQHYAGAETAMAVLLQGLKGLEGEVAKASSDTDSHREDNKQQVASAAPSLAQDPELLQDFVVEAREHLGMMETQLLALEQNPDDPEPTHACFRAIHTIKGVSGFLELHAVREVAHEGETLLDELRNSRLPVNPALIDTLLQTADFLQGEVTAIANFLSGAPTHETRSPASLLERLRAAGRLPTSEILVPEVKMAPVTDRREAPRLAALEKTSVGQREGGTEPRAAAASAALNSPKQPGDTRQGSSPPRRTVKIDMEKLDYLADMVGELVVTQSMLRPEEGGRASADTPLMRNLLQLARITAEVQKTTMSMRMVPIGQMFQRLARLVRDVSRQVGKTVDLELSGEEIELDRNLVEELVDPLMHMVRNSIDHGIEPVAEKKARGKSSNGRISLKAKHDAGHVQIEISDNGRGLDTNKILAKARQLGLVEPQASLADNDILNLIFEPGFSTAEKVTDLSGRGVGMDVVRKQIQKLRGHVDVSSIPGQGTTFFLRLPLTLAIIDGLVIGLGTERYIIPISAVKEVLRPTEDMMFTVEARNEMVMVRNGLMPLVRLHRRLGVKPRSEQLEHGILVILESHGKYYCLAVDELLGKQEVVIKSLGELMRSASEIAGGAILGDGRIALILDTDAIAGKSIHE
jgi:two-component system, chemotaxis family, sensor kinase CheA